jgi:hypothetical protein
VFEFGMNLMGPETGHLPPGVVLTFSDSGEQGSAVRGVQGASAG